MAEETCVTDTNCVPKADFGTEAISNQQPTSIPDPAPLSSRDNKDAALRIFCISDVHTEMRPRTVPIPECDLLILAGDIGSVGRPTARANLISFLEFCLTRCSRVVYVPGNHEYYCSAINRADEKIREIIPPEVHLLNCDSYEFDHLGRRFIVYGCTLWSEVRSPDVAKFEMNDYSKIKVATVSYSLDGNIIGYGEYLRMEPSTIQNLHKEHKKWLLSSLSRNEADRLPIVVTHHVPVILDQREWETDPIASCYYSDLSDVIEEYRPKLWVHGHTHKSGSHSVGATTLHSNQVGYPGHPSDYNPHIQIFL
jgi:predicted phosphohydrolase